MIGGLPRNSLVFMEFEDGGGVFELAALVLAALELDIAGGGLGAGGWGLSAREDIGFQERDPIYAPGCVGELLDQLGFGCGGGLVFVDELAAVALVCGRVL